MSQARGTAAFAHAAAQLPASHLPEVAQLLEQLRPKLQRFAAQGAALTCGDSLKISHVPFDDLLAYYLDLFKGLIPTVGIKE